MEKIKILVVDDESRMRKLVRDFLVREDYEVLEAGDGEAALDIFYQEKKYCIDHFRCHDAKDERMGGLQGNQGDFESANHHADGEGG